MIPIIYGWGKGLKAVAYAGIEKCSHCKNYGHFWICEHSSHASLYFLKVARWNKKWVYVCKTCQRGWEIDPEQKDDAIKQTVPLPSPENCLLMWNRLDQAVCKVIKQQEQTGQGSLMASIKSALSETIEVLKTDFQEDHSAYVARRYITYLQDQDKPR